MKKRSTAGSRRMVSRAPRPASPPNTADATITSRKPITEYTTRGLTGRRGWRSNIAARTTDTTRIVNGTSQPSNSHGRFHWKGTTAPMTYAPAPTAADVSGATRLRVAAALLVVRARPTARIGIIAPSRGDGSERAGGNTRAKTLQSVG